MVCVCTDVIGFCMCHCCAGPLLSVSVEKSPLDKSVDLRVCVNALPVKIIYEAVSLSNCLSNCCCAYNLNSLYTV